jgi:hypothetical protein
MQRSLLTDNKFKVSTRTGSVIYSNPENKNHKSNMSDSSESSRSEKDLIKEIEYPIFKDRHCSDNCCAARDELAKVIAALSDCNSHLESIALSLKILTEVRQENASGKNRKTKKAPRVVVVP